MFGLPVSRTGRQQVVVVGGGNVGLSLGLGPGVVMVGAPAPASVYYLQGPQVGLVPVRAGFQVMCVTCCQLSGFSQYACPQNQTGSYLGSCSSGSRCPNSGNTHLTLYWVPGGAQIPNPPAPSYSTPSFTAPTSGSSGPAMPSNPAALCQHHASPAYRTGARCVHGSRVFCGYTIRCNHPGCTYAISNGSMGIIYVRPGSTPDGYHN